MSSSSPFKKKQFKEAFSFQDLENIPRTFAQLKNQKTHRTLLDSDVHMLGDSRKTIMSEFRQDLSLRQSMKQNIQNYYDETLISRQNKIMKLEQSLFQQKCTNQSLKDELQRSKLKIKQLTMKLQQGIKQKQQPKQENGKLVGILKNNIKKQQLDENQTLRFGVQKFPKIPRLDTQNSRLKKHIQHLEQSLKQCKFLLSVVEDKSTSIQSQYEAHIRILKMKNQYLEYQIKVNQQ